MKGLCQLAEEADGFDLAEHINSLAVSVGARTRVDGRVSRWITYEDHDESVEVSMRDLSVALADRQEVHFQLWFLDGTDLFCSTYFLQARIVLHEFAFRGLDSGQRELVINFAVNRFEVRCHAARSVLLLVVGNDEYEDVDLGLVLGSGANVPVLNPDIIGFNPSRAVVSPEALIGRENWSIGACVLSKAVTLKTQDRPDDESR